MNRRALAFFHASQGSKSFWILVFATWISFGLCLPAQQSPPLPAWRGVLHNAAGAPVSGAQVKLSGNNETTEAKTGADGQFHCKPLPPGQYRSEERRVGKEC